MMKKLYLPLWVAMLLLITACSKKAELTADYFTTTPNVLEAVAGQVPVTITGKIPAKCIKKKAVVTITPVIKWDGGEVKGESFTLQGEAIRGNGKKISYKNGGTFTMKHTFKYRPEMLKSELYLEFKATVKGKAVAMPALKIADGVIATSELVYNTVLSATTAYADDHYQRIVDQTKQANIMFLIQQATVRASETESDVIRAFNALVQELDADKKGHAVEGIEVKAYASPDGGYALNEKLAAAREAGAADYVHKTLKKNKIYTEVISQYTAEDWEGFKELVAKSQIPDRDIIIRVLDMYDDPEQREQEIKNLSSVYKDLADEILPQLRRARLTLLYKVIGRTDEEIIDQFEEDASKLSIEELLYIATTLQDVDDKETIYERAIQLYPKDYRSYNNMGALAFDAGDLGVAEEYLKKALRIAPLAAEPNANMALVSLANGDLDACQTYLANASGAKNLEEAFGNYYLATGQYERAANTFGTLKVNSAGLAQILIKDYTKAEQTLYAVRYGDAYTAYLEAIRAARVGSLSGVVSKLATAVERDSSIKKRAAKDIEFAGFADSSTFRKTIK